MAVIRQYKGNVRPRWTVQAPTTSFILTSTVSNVFILSYFVICTIEAALREAILHGHFMCVHKSLLRVDE
eukprot:1485226-Pleurochrysis_carterae.AAC.1